MVVRAESCGTATPMLVPVAFLVWGDDVWNERRTSQVSRLTKVCLLDLYVCHVTVCFELTAELMDEWVCDGSFRVV